MVNLLDNAVKFNRPDGEVVVECLPVNQKLIRISVADSGIGIPNDDVKRIFERFYRVDKSRSRPAGGTGLGLPIVKEVVERMGGTVSVESTLGRGSKFTVLLPAS
jgi:signal transduction histidine kinase